MSFRVLLPIIPSLSISLLLKLIRSILIFKVDLILREKTKYKGTSI